MIFCRLLSNLILVILSSPLTYTCSKQNREGIYFKNGDLNLGPAFLRQPAYVDSLGVLFLFYSTLLAWLHTMDTIKLCPIKFVLIS